MCPLLCSFTKKPLCIACSTVGIDSIVAPPKYQSPPSLVHVLMLCFLFVLAVAATICPLPMRPPARCQCARPYAAHTLAACWSGAAHARYVNFRLLSFAQEIMQRRRRYAGLGARLRTRTPYTPMGYASYPRQLHPTSCLFSQAVGHVKLFTIYIQVSEFTYSHLTSATPRATLLLQRLRRRRRKLCHRRVQSDAHERTTSRGCSET